VTGPFVVIWCSHPLRKATKLDDGGVLRLTMAPAEAQHFDTVELAQAAIAETEANARRWGHPVSEYEVLPLEVWEDEQEAQTKRDQEREARAKQRSKKAATKEPEE
jgi:hypothetical protein